MKLKLTFLLAAACLSPLFSQTTDANRKTAHAVRVEKAPKLDGILDDECWKMAVPATDFITNSPSFGQPSAEKTEIWITYTDEAIYIGAYLFMQDVSKIRTDLSKRDAGGPVDQIHIGLDTYRDRQNAFRFEISAAGVQRDARMGLTTFDVNWDAVWDSKVKINTDGWVAEIRIPFSAIRFAKKPEQVWGLQFARQVQYLNEFSTWSPVDPNGGGSLPQWGNLDGLKDLDPPLRLSFSPYLAGSVEHSPLENQKPTDFVKSRSIEGGMDVKWGINQGFTLDATLIPNFGEAQSDNTVRNLSPFEQQYEERRQFFTEGTELFSKGEIFYSRRIGGLPSGFSAATKSLTDHEIIKKNPSQQQLFNATKISGRTKHNLGIGFLNAVAGSTFAKILDEETGLERDFQTDVLTNYNVFVLDQALKNNSAISLTNTNVLREGVRRDANVSALQFNLRDKKNKYEIEGSGQFSQVFNPSDTAQKDAKTGYGYGLGINKVSGKYTWNTFVSGTSDKFDQRDLAINDRNNFFRQFAQISRGDYEPKRNRLYSFWQINATNTFLATPQKWESLELMGYFEIMNKRQVLFGLVALSRPVWYFDYFEPRVFGKKYHHAPWAFIETSITTDGRKKFRASFNLTYGESPIPNDPYIGASIKPTWTVNDHVILRGVTRFSKDHSNFGAVNWWNDPNDVIFGRRDIHSVDNSIAAEYLFTPRMSATFRARHYWSKLFYHQYYHLLDDGNFSPAPDWNQPADENFNLFNIDFVYTWQFAPGSFLNLIWKDAVFQGDVLRQHGYFKNLRKTADTPQDNSLTLKLIYYLDAGGWKK